MKRTILIVFTAVLGIATHAVAGEFAQYGPILGGTTADYQWDGFTKPSGVSSGISGKTSEWTSGIQPDNSSSSIVFSGDPSFGNDTTDFLSDGGIYSFFSQTYYMVNSSAPLNSLASLTFQIYMAAGTTNSSGGTPQDVAAAPSLTLTVSGSPVSIGTADFSLLQSSEDVFIPSFGIDTTLDSLGYQWDLSAVSGTITAYQINWQTSFHSIVYGVDVTESTAIHTSNILQTIPEPSTCASICIGILGLACLKLVRNRRTA